MLRFRAFVQKMLILVTLSILAVTGVLYMVSNQLTQQLYTSISRRELEECITLGRSLLDRLVDGECLKEEAEALLSPELNPGDVTAALYDTAGNLLAVSRGAAAFAPEMVEAALDMEEGGAPEEMEGPGPEDERRYTLGVRTAKGAVLAGKVISAYDDALYSFRLSLLLYMGPLALLLVAATIVVSIRMAKPATVIVDAANRLSDGELVQVTEKLPMEFKPIGRAFNRMSYRLSSTIRDLTYERDTFALVLEGLNEGVIAMDEEGDLLHQNSAALRLLDGRGSEPFQGVLRGMRGSMRETPRTDRFMVGERVIQVNYAALPIRGGQRRGVLAMIRDTTEEERLERTRKDYVANITHELRTPLAGMRGIAEGLRDGLVEDENQRIRYYGILVSEIRRLSRLVDDLLELGSLQSNPAAFEREKVDPSEALLELHDRMSRTAQERGISFVLSGAEGELPPVYTNEDRLQQVLTILLDNAFKYTQDGGEVTLGAENTGRGIRFFVRDNGIGMDEHTLRHAMDRFHQAEPGYGKKGFGLGLAIAREVLERLGSEMQIKSKKGGGSEFSFILPAMEKKKTRDLWRSVP